MKSSKSLLILIPFLIGGIPTAKSEVIIPANTQLEQEYFSAAGVSENSDLLHFLKISVVRHQINFIRAVVVMELFGLVLMLYLIQ